MASEDSSHRNTTEPSLRERMREIIEGYTHSFTMHGLTTALTAVSLAERLTWAVIIAAAFVFTGYLCKDMVLGMASNELSSEYWVRKNSS